MGPAALKNLLNAIAFLTRVPVAANVTGPNDLARSVPWFPIVGAIVGLIIGVVALSAGFLLPPFVAAAVAVGIGILITGAFHEDGLADTFDALGGSFTRERALEILRDPRLGTFGTIALVIALLIRIAAIASILPGSEILLVLAGAHALARSSSVAVMAAMTAVRTEGLGADYLSALDRRRAIVGSLAGAVIAVMLLGPAAIPAIPAAALGAGLIARWARARIEGVTGDVLGACAMAAETVVLVVLSAHSNRVLIGW